MRPLLDTHTLLWFQTDDPKLSMAAKTAIEDPTNERWLSPISLLEIAIKNRLGKLPLPGSFGALYPASLVSRDIHLLPLEAHPLSISMNHAPPPPKKTLTTSSILSTRARTSCRLRTGRTSRASCA